MRTRGTWLPAGLILLVVLGGSYVRLVDLGQPDFYNDELYILYAAESLGRGEGPLLPSGEVYGRGLDITRMVGFALRYIDHPETAARLPSAAFGILGLILFAVIAWAMAGPWAAVWCALLLAIYPEAISQSRITRFYTYQLTFGLVAFYAGWRAVRTAGLPIPDGSRRSVLLREWGWTLLALLAFTLAARVQSTTLSTFAAWSLGLGLAAIADLYVRGRAAWLYSARVQAVTLGLAWIALLLVTNPAYILHLLEVSQAVPAWAGSTAGDVRGYYWAIAGNFPVILALLPVCILVTAFLNGRLAAFLAIWFLVPFLLHSFALPWKSERYLLLAMPAFFMLAAVPAVVGSRALFGRARDAVVQAGGGRVLSRGAAGAVVGAAACFGILATPAFHAARTIPPFVVDLHWRTALSIINSLPERESLVLGSSYPIGSLYYWDRVDFGVSTVSLERVPLPADRQGRWSRWVRYDDGVPDYYSAAPIITRPQAIRDRFPDAGAAVIAIDRGHVLFGHMQRSLMDALSAEGVELCQGACGRMLLYYWPFDQEVEIGVRSDSGTGDPAASRDEVLITQRPEPGSVASRSP